MYGYFYFKLPNTNKIAANTQNNLINPVNHNIQNNSQNMPQSNQNARDQHVPNFNPTHFDNKNQHLQKMNHEI